MSELSFDQLIDGPNTEIAALRAELARVSAERDEENGWCELYKRQAERHKQRGDQYRRRALALLERMRLCRQAHRSNVNISIDAQVRAQAAEAALSQARAEQARLRALLGETLSFLDDITNRFAINCADGKTRWIGGGEVAEAVTALRGKVAAALAGGQETE